jgi:uncharacterized membrane protein
MNENIQRIELVKTSYTNKTSLVYVLATILGYILGAFFVMLALGVLHSNIDAVPALGYWATLVVLIGFRVLLPNRNSIYKYLPYNSKD